MHSTSNLDDGYMGGGTRIRNSIRCHGREIHHKEILEYLPDRISLSKRESEIINEDLLKDPLCMNLNIGGEGIGLPIPHREESKRKIGKSNSILQSGTKNSQFGSIWISNGKISKKINKSDKIPNGWIRGRTGKKEYIENTEKRSNKGCNNSQFGSIWITDGYINKRHTKGEEVPKGWSYGKSYPKLKNLGWITNGFENKRLYKDLIIPEGWKSGKTQDRKVF